LSFGGVGIEASKIVLKLGDRRKRPRRRPLRSIIAADWPPFNVPVAVTPNGDNRLALAAAALPIESNVLLSVKMSAVPQRL
jgi:hypothetical protein